VKRFLLLVCAGLVLFGLSCPKKEFDVLLKFSNPQSKSVPFNGYYLVSSTGDSVEMKGTTPGEYRLTAKSGEQIKGTVNKDSPDLVDTLEFQISVDEEEKLNQRTTNRIIAIQFQIDVL